MSIFGLHEILLPAALFPPWLQEGKKWTQNNGTERINVSTVTQPNGDILITFDDASTLNITSTDLC